MADTTPEPDPEAAKAEQKRSDNKILAWLAVGFVVLAMGCGALLGGGDDDSGELSGEEIRAGAFDVCTKFVSDRLRAPATASFRNYYEDDGEVQVTGFGDGPYTVRSSVDAENGFGANIRTDFVCEVRHTGDGNFRLVDLQMME